MSPLAVLDAFSGLLAAYGGVLGGLCGAHELAGSRMNAPGWLHGALQSAFVSLMLKKAWALVVVSTGFRKASVPSGNRCECGMSKLLCAKICNARIAFAGYHFNSVDLDA